MTIPTYKHMMLPTLRFLSDGNEKRTQEIYAHIYKTLNLTPDEIRTRTSTGKNVASTRVSWGLTHMKKAGLITNTAHGVFQISNRGQSLLMQNPPAIDRKLLMKYPEYRAFRLGERVELIENAATYEGTEKELPESEKTPEEMIEDGMQQIGASLGDELMERVMANSPSFFEQVVLDLLTNMGYGSGKVTGRTGDGGIDGYINQDNLGLERIFFQAKRWSNNVGAKELRDFIGALEINNMSKGVFITTSGFPSESNNLVERCKKSIKLIDGKRLVSLMIAYDVGVTGVRTYIIKKLDEDYFEEDT